MEPLERRVQLSVSLALSGTQTITPGSVVNASSDSSAWETEMSVVVNPTNPLNLAGFSHNREREMDDALSMDVFYSTDGGATWTTNVINGNDDGLDSLGTPLARGDPTLTFDEEGRLYIAYGFLYLAGEPAIGHMNLMVAVDSTNGGASFDHFEEVDSQSGGIPLDKWLITAGRDPTTNDPAVYVAYTSNVGSQHIVVAGSNDGGDSFTTPTTVSDFGHPGLFATPAVGPNGELYVSWQTVGGTDKNIYIDLDSNGLFDGADFGTDVTVRTPGSAGMFQYTDQHAQPDRGIHTGPVLTVDRSGGTYDGRLYLAFAELNGTPGSSEDSNIKLGYSDNDGSSWTFLTVDSSTGTEFLPWIDVDQATGSVHLFYYTTEDDQSTGNEDVKMRMGVSLNGGASWTLSNVTTITSDEYEEDDNTDDYNGDYLEYIGLDVHQGTAHGLFAFEPTNVGSGRFDLEAFYVNAGFVNSNNTLTIEGDDSGSTNDTIIVRKHPTNNDYLQVLVNSVEQFAGRYDTIGKLVINGLNGNDTITVNSNVSIPATIDGGGGNDSLTGGSGNDSIYGYGGADILVGGLGSDRMEGGDDNDEFSPVDGIADQLFGGAGTDRAYGMDASDTEEDIELFGPPGGGGSGPSP
jgi:hypothetical protein